MVWAGEAAQADRHTGCSSTISTASTVATRTGSSASMAAGVQSLTRSWPSSSTAACWRPASPVSVATSARPSFCWHSGALRLWRKGCESLPDARCGTSDPPPTPRRPASPHLLGASASSPPPCRPQRSVGAPLAAVIHSPPPIEILSLIPILLGNLYFTRAHVALFHAQKTAVCDRAKYSCAPIAPSRSAAGTHER